MCVCRYTECVCECLDVIGVKVLCSFESVRKRAGQVGEKHGAAVDHKRRHDKVRRQHPRGIGRRVVYVSMNHSQVAGIVAGQ